MRERNIVSRPVEYVGVRVDQALGRRRDLRQLEHVAELLRWLVRALVGLPLKALADEPGGSALRVIAVLVVAPLFRIAPPGVHVRWPHPADLHAARSRIFLTIMRAVRASDGAVTSWRG
jgi:hypothetical protein